MTLIALYREMADLTNAICRTCDPPFKCCSLIGCSRAKFWAEHVYKINLVKTNGRLPFLTETGCTVAPHHRPICTMFFCPDKQEPVRIKELRAEIVKLEAQRWKTDQNR